MNKDKRLTILIILIVTLSLVGIGIAFAAFSQTLTINGSAEVEASSWQVVFEGMTNANTLDAPTTTGTAAEVTHPTIKNNSTEISTYSVSMKTPGDSITYNFKIHNKGDFAANLSALTISGVNRPVIPVSGASLVTDSSIATANAKTLSKITYKLYYTTDNTLVGQYSARDCLEPGESVNVSLKITFSTTSERDAEVLPSTDLVLDNLGITAVYNQMDNGSCPLEPGVSVVDVPFENIDYSYYEYEGKRFIGTGVDNTIVTEYVIGNAKYSSEPGVDQGSGANPRYKFVDTPAIDMAESYCTGCRLLNRTEAEAWGCQRSVSLSKCVARTSTGTGTYAWLGSNNPNRLYISAIYPGGNIDALTATDTHAVRPAVSIPSTATMSGSGSKLDPYVITVN